MRLRPAMFGYEKTEGGNTVPVEEELEILEQVKEMVELGAISLRDGAQWISSETGRSISHEGLRKRLAKPVRIEA